MIELHKNPLNRSLLLNDKDIHKEVRSDSGLLTDPEYLAYLIARYGKDIVYGYSDDVEYDDYDDDEYFDYRCRNKNSKNMIDNTNYNRTMDLLGRYADKCGKKKVNKRGGKRGRKKGKKYSDDDLMITDAYNDKIIYFYRDEYNPDDYERFTSLYEFDEFLNSEGIYISEYEVNQLMNRDVSHCAINPYQRLYHDRLELISSGSYSDLRYSFIDSIDGCGSI